MPKFESLFRDSDTEDSSDEENYDDLNQDDDNRLTNAEKFERRIKKNRELREWNNKRNQVLFNYTQYSFYSRSSALTLFELAWQLSKDSLDLLWWAIVGITEQLIAGKIESSVYTLETQKIQSHVTRLLNKAQDQHQLVRYLHWQILIF